MNLIFKESFTNINVITSAASHLGYPVEEFSDFAKLDGKPLSIILSDSPLYEDFFTASVGSVSGKVYDGKRVIIIVKFSKTIVCFQRGENPRLHLDFLMSECNLDYSGQKHCVYQNTFSVYPCTPIFATD